MKDNQLVKLVEGIVKVISWYSQSNSKDGELLTAAKQKLLGYSFTFSSAVGEALDTYNRAYAHRKAETARLILEYASSGESQFKASMKAEIEVKDMRLVESGYESIYRRLKGQQDTINNTISSMMQDIKRLETEFKQAGN
jgi:arginine deiminase